MTRGSRPGRKKKLRAIGLMSGTSADSVDAALVDVDLSRAKPRIGFLDYQSSRMPAALRKRIIAACDLPIGVDEVCQLNVELGELFARAACRLMRSYGLSSSDVDVIGSHGQTVYHIPRRDRKRGWRTKSTLQLGDPSIIAERTGVATVGDFRARDIAAGGEGAPLVPRIDDFLFGRSKQARIAQNIGGIANATFLPARGTNLSIIAFDTGPGNMVIDALCEHFSGGKEKMDRGGKHASSGTVDEDWLKSLLRHPYFKRKPPKSTGRELFGRQYALQLAEEGERRGLSRDDIIATATLLTVESIAGAYKTFLSPLGAAERIIVSGGGARNKYLLTRLAERLPETPVETSDEWGIPVDAKEAVAFAVLGALTICGWTGNVPSVTGARRAVPLGVIAWV